MIRQLILGVAARPETATMTVIVLAAAEAMIRTEQLQQVIIRFLTMLQKVPLELNGPSQRSEV